MKVLLILGYYLLPILGITFSVLAITYFGLKLSIRMKLLAKKKFFKKLIRE